MKHLTMILIAISALAISSLAVGSTSPSAASSTAITSTGDKCIDTAQSQADMSGCAVKSLNAVDKELNQVYQQVLRKYAKDPVFVAKLKTAQKAWLAFRDAELAARFPDSDKSNYGSVYPMCADNEVEAMTRKRIDELRAWLKGTQEGDVCAGSYQTS